MKIDGETLVVAAIVLTLAGIVFGVGTCLSRDAASERENKSKNIDAENRLKLECLSRQCERGAIEWTGSRCACVTVTYDAPKKMGQ